MDWKKTVLVVLYALVFLAAGVLVSVACYCLDRGTISRRALWGASVAFGVGVAAGSLAAGLEGVS